MADGRKGTQELTTEWHLEVNQRTAGENLHSDGSKAVTKVIAKRDQLNPRRALFVTWQPPTDIVQGYRLILYDLTEKTSVHEDVSGSKLEHRYVELKTSNPYRIRVCPIYNGLPCYGTFSKIVKTEKRIDYIAANKPGFGQSEKIVHVVKVSSKEKSIIDLSWTSVQMGENFKVTGYRVSVHQKKIAYVGKRVSEITSRTIFNKVVKPRMTTIELDLRRGHKFDVKVSTISVDLDTKEKVEFAKEYEIFTDPSKTVINDCTCKNGIVNFSWEPVDGAIRYCLVIKDELLHMNLVPDQNFDVKSNSNSCIAKLQMSEELRIGRTCMTKVYVYSAGERFSETDWKSHILGGERVPRNVGAFKNPENPKRSVIITFDSPKQGPAPEYKIVSIPESGLRRTTYCNSSNTVMEYLRKGVKYKFEVHAKWGHDWSEGSPSNSISTEGDEGKPFMGVHDLHQTKVDLTNAVLAGKSVAVNVNLGKDFGQVEDLEPKIEADHANDILTLKWNAPNFDKKTADYKVELFKVEISKQNDSGWKSQTVGFEKNRLEYQSAKMKLELGETYQVAVSTIYLDIDQDYVFKSTAVKREVFTRPCIPECIRNDYDNDTLRMEWNAAKGAQRYMLEIFANNDTQATFRVDMGKKTSYEKKFDERFGYGTSYYAIIKAFGVTGKKNSSKAPTKIIDLGTPKNVVLRNNVENFSSSLILMFSNAEGGPLNYMATLYKCTNKVEQPIGEPMEVEPGYTFHDLEPNSKYLVKIYANFASGAGKVVQSMMTITAPSKTQITECRCGLMENGEKSPRKLFVKWNPDKGCNIHEVIVMCDETGTIESRLLIEDKDELNYPCMHESIQYSVRVRSRKKPGHFGEWSDERLIHLAPAKLQGVSAALDENGSDILIECHAALTHPTRYFMQALCNGKEMGKPEESQEEKETVKWRFTPPESAQVYSFKLWAENDEEMRGEKTLSSSVISRPSKAVFKSVKLGANYESTDIEMEWEQQQRCDVYEISICALDEVMPETVAITSGTTYRYRCQVPGKIYLVSTRAIREGIRGEWSDEQMVNLAPVEINFLWDLSIGNDPVTCVEVSWEALPIPPVGYLLKLFCNDEEVEEIVTTSTNHKFINDLKPGSLCFCTVAAFNDSNFIGKASKSRTYRIKWLQATNFVIENDENDPSRRAKMKWDVPSGVNCFRLEIENNQTGVVTPIYLSAPSYVFESGIPGNTYSVRLYCGCDERYDMKHVAETMKMYPDPPSDVRVTAKGHVSGLTIEFNDTPSTRKQYEVTMEGLVNPEQIMKKVVSHRSVTMRDLVPGESYKVSICTVIGVLRSKEVASEGYIATIPAGVVNLHSKMDKGNLQFEWDEPEIKPTKYIVEWRVNNEPITEEHTQEPSFMIFFLKPAHCYSARVLAVNSSGKGSMSNWENFITDPSPPYGVRVYPDPESPQTSLVVKFQDEKDPLKRYKIVAECLEDTLKTVITHEQFVVLSGLQPGRAYMVKAQTLFCGKESTWAHFSGLEGGVLDSSTKQKSHESLLGKGASSTTKHAAKFVGCGPLTSKYAEAKSERMGESSRKPLGIVVENLPETSLFIELPLLATIGESVQFVAKSQSSGKTIAAMSSEGHAIIEGIDPGDKYFVYAYKGNEFNSVCIGKYEIQTRKSINRKGGSVIVGNVELVFPPGAVKNKSMIEVLPCVENNPDPPSGSVFVIPPMDFRSTEREFSELVTCKLHIPFINVEKAIEVDIVYFENNEWLKVCSRYLTQTKSLEFKCEHFTIYAIVTYAPYSVVRHIPFLSYEMCNYIYFDKEDNFVGVTCLNYEPIIQKCHQFLSNSQYLRTPHVISPNVFKKFGGNATKYTLKCCDPEHIIGNWEMSLDQEFVENHWRDLKDLNGMRENIPDKKRIQLSLVRNHEDHGPKEWTKNMKYPLEKNIPDRPLTVQGNLFQGGQPTVHFTGALPIGQQQN